MAKTKTSFKKGEAKGKPKGALNRSTAEIRTMLQTFVEANISKLQADFDKLQPEKRLIFFDKMLSQILPKPLDELQRLSESDLDELIKRLKQHDN
jgi:hypothetical protein